MTVKETYHADCLRIKQLEQQLARYKEYYNATRKDDVETIIRLVKEFESEQNER